MIPVSITSLKETNTNNYNNNKPFYNSKFYYNNKNNNKRKNRRKNRNKFNCFNHLSNKVRCTVEKIAVNNRIL